MDIYSQDKSEESKFSVNFILLRDILSLDNWFQSKEAKNFEQSENFHSWNRSCEYECTQKRKYVNPESNLSDIVEANLDWVRLIISISVHVGSKELEEEIDEKQNVNDCRYDQVALGIEDRPGKTELDGNLDWLTASCNHDNNLECKD